MPHTLSPDDSASETLCSLEYHKMDEVKKLSNSKYNTCWAYGLIQETPQTFPYSVVFPHFEYPLPCSSTFLSSVSVRVPVLSCT
jgi:hypothetical protein